METHAAQPDTAPEAKPFDYTFVETVGRIALYDDLLSAPRVIEIQPAATGAYIEALASSVYEQARGAGGSIPYTVIREVSENFIHAQFKGVLVTIRDQGNTIVFADHGPGIPSKEKAQMPGFSSAVEPMRNYIRGVGSGLPIVREYLESSHGTITIEDNLGTGAVVTISLAGADEEEDDYIEVNPYGAMPQASPYPGGVEGAAAAAPTYGVAPGMTGAAVAAPATAQPYGYGYAPAPAPAASPYGATAGQPLPGTYAAAPVGAPLAQAMPYPAVAPVAGASTLRLNKIQQEMLRLLAVEGSLGNADICRRLGAKPSTVTNNFNELRDKSLVTKDGQKYTLTPYGAQVIPGLL